MNYPLICNNNSFSTISPKVPRVRDFNVKPMFCTSFHSNNPSSNTVNRGFKLPLIDKTRPVLSPNIVRTGSGEVSVRESKRGKGEKDVKRGFGEVGIRQMLVLCGLGYWVQGFRCFPWLALNFHMAHNLNLHPSTLQLVQYSGNLPMVAKPLYGILSDALYIGGAHRIPYICIGVLLQILSWGPLALVPVVGKALPTLMACVLLSNLGASIEEVAKDAVVAEYGQKHRMVGLQSYAFMAAAAGGILGNLLGGYILPKVPPTTMFLMFGVLLSVQLTISLSVKEGSLGLAQPSHYDVPRKSISESIKKQISNLVMAISEESISRPLTWLVASVAMVPILSGSIFCYQTQCLNLDPSVIGMSRVIGQLTLLTLTVLYDRYWKKVSLRKLIGIVQISYAFSLLLDFILVRQINLQLGIPNEVFALCFSGLAETLAQFKLLPFSMLLASLCPQGCEGSLTSFSASTLCLSSIASGFLGIGLASLIGITSQDYSSLPVGILIQFLAALVPLLWIHHVPMSQPLVEKVGKKGMSKRTRKNRRVGKVVLDSVYVYRRERESGAQK
ncbi:probable folate-biopterin transporter 8, chloroplastic [Pistacia vera]|uniref:probable folate-biopterin transporter 8, chloroplastic n=1 Tax=Pistacia vera TaxID=55513 RepID=UPI001262E9A8|nr:probable folate-biopterin transporter 8, chloroplastic [Pistacia vera]XP_031275049.1 probable folate-biopterin transporter 8, chloroplastic [Pistacia vera]